MSLSFPELFEEKRFAATYSFKIFSKVKETWSLESTRNSRAPLQKRNFRNKNSPFPLEMQFQGHLEITRTVIPIFEKSEKLENSRLDPKTFPPTYYTYINSPLTRMKRQCIFPHEEEEIWGPHMCAQGAAARIWRKERKKKKKRSLSKWRSCATGMTRGVSDAVQNESVGAVTSSLWVTSGPSWFLGRTDVPDHLLRS